MPPFSATGRAAGHAESVCGASGLPSNVPGTTSEPKWRPRGTKYTENGAQDEANIQLEGSTNPGRN